MMKSDKNTTVAEPDLLEKIKKLVIVAMFSDDELMEQLVLKGGNALDLVHGISSRASIDVDFSMERDFSEGPEAFLKRIDNALATTFQAERYKAFDVKMWNRPEPLSKDLAHFWGGYFVEFKLIDMAQYQKQPDDIEQLRRQALMLGQRQKFLIDVSRHEYTAEKESHEIDGIRIFVYSPAMLVCEKLRAICQQMPEYGPIVKRGRAGTARARDFLDIHSVMTKYELDLKSANNVSLLREIFAAKMVPLTLLGKITRFRDFHRIDFPSVQATIKPGVRIESFDFYFDYVAALAEQLKPFWNV